MKKVLLLVLVTLAFLACGKKEETSSKKDVKKVGLVLNLGGLGDKSFNDSAYKGLLRAKDELGVDFKYVEPASISDFGGYLDDYAANGFDLVVAIGFDMETPLKEIAPQYPETKFVVVDAVVDEPNVTSILFNSKEGSFVVGALGAMMSETDKIGYIGGLDIFFLNEFRDGYTAGAKYINEEVEVVDLYVGGGNPFNDPAKAKEITLSLKNAGADVMFSVSGGSGRGMMEAINENDGIYGIGVDSNQDGEVEGKILTSMIKRVDNSLFQIVESLVAGDLESGVKVFGIAEGGVSTTDYEYTKDIIGEEKLARLKEIEEKIISKEIEIN